MNAVLAAVNVGSHRDQVLRDGFVRLGIVEIQPLYEDIFADQGSRAEEECRAGEVGGYGHVECGVVLAAGDAEEAQVVFHLVLDALPVEPVERDASVVGFVEQGDANLRIAFGQGTGEQQTGQVLA